MRYILTAIIIGLTGLFVLPIPAAKAATYICSANGKTVTSAPPQLFNLYIGPSIPGYFVSDKVKELAFFQKIKDTGVYSVRVNIAWNGIEPSLNQYDWIKYDAMFESIQQAGLVAEATLVGIPDWAKPTGGAMIIDPSHYADWQTYIRAAVGRYNIHSGTVTKAVSIWEIWNEPYQDTVWQGSAADMVTTLNLAYSTIKGIDPQAQVWSPSVGNAAILTGLAYGPKNNKQDFFTVTVANGHFDSLGLHLYTDNKSAYTLTQFSKQYLRSHGNTQNKNAKIDITETNLNFIGPANCGAVNNLTDQAMANMITDRYVCLSQAGADAVYYFISSDLMNQTCSNGDTTIKVGILNADLSPRPSYFALQRMIASLTGQNPPSSPTLIPTPAARIPGDLTDYDDKPGDQVNIYDYSILMGDFGKKGVPGFLPDDITGDKGVPNGEIDIYDYNALISNFGL
jgi:hypothetical protein